MDRTPTPGNWSWWVKAKRAMNPDDFETWQRGGVCPTLNGFDSGDSRATVVVFQQSSMKGKGTMGVDVDASVAKPVKTQPDHQMIVGPAVRRLTPRECERLQGFPDDWTAIGSDSARYKQMGNAVTVNAAQYVAALIDTAVRESA